MKNHTVGLLLGQVEIGDAKRDLKIGFDSPNALDAQRKCLLKIAFGQISDAQFSLV